MSVPRNVILAFVLSLAAIAAAELPARGGKPAIERIWLTHQTHQPDRIVVSWEGPVEGAAVVEFGNDTALAQRVDGLLEGIARQAESRKIQKSLSPGNPFPEFSVKDIEGNPLGLAALKGKVVLIDFWATWCGPCVAELPHVLKAYEKHHAQGFEIIGISLDKEKAQLTSFLTREKMTWPQHLDGEDPKASLAAKYGVETIPSTFLLDREGKIIERDLRGEALETAVAKAVAGN
jgi:peroxiredoxin